ncbi:4'-phosphopantetheinyl transferase superfamily protein [Catenulispora sp. NF23]|uniref:4'-phosphopantetheinyl transferase family protein n=1 Tax=Catenulispora pinistramenti TaxID=2705254 RepID=UPI001BA90C5C|nr:4'-phosphopantetheinyl transferase superfamily protein [Catenulispora pinistramenti]MBS2537822.1 4'-phosphopantetheinyl transferase superfamily protein [Catenulispora pinistramenti]
MTDRTDRIRVWVIRTDTAPETAENYESLLDEDETAHAADFLQERDRHRYLVAHGARRVILGRELDLEPQAVTFAVDANGKPELAGGVPHISLAHDGALALLAVAARRTVGVDVCRLAESLDPVDMSERYFLPFEARYVAGGHDLLEQTDRYARLWTRKEAAAKVAGGVGWANTKAAVLQRDLVACVEPAGHHRHRVLPVPVPSGYRAAVALFGEAPFQVEVMGFEA